MCFAELPEEYFTGVGKSEAWRSSRRVIQVKKRFLKDPRCVPYLLGEYFGEEKQRSNSVQKVP